MSNHDANAGLAAAPGSAFRDELHALVNAHASKIGPQEAAFWLACMAHSALAHLMWMPTETRQAKELLAKSCDLLPLPNASAELPPPSGSASTQGAVGG